MPNDDGLPGLTPREEALLQKHMRFYRALETGQRKPTTAAQEHFVQVTRGLAAAETTHEWAYVKHMRLRAAWRAAQGSEGSPEGFDEPREEWFSREAWYRSRGRQRNDMRD